MTTAEPIATAAATAAELTVDTLRALVERATLAPSTRNTQPWRWRLEPGRCRLELIADRARALPANDPGGRELVMSCGAALLTLRVAAARALLRTEIDTEPDPRRPDLLATVQLAGGAVDAAFSALDAAVPLRHTWWRRFQDRPVPLELLERMTAEAADEGARLFVVPPELRADVAWLARQADLARFDDPRRRAELAGLQRPGWQRSGSRRPVVSVLPSRVAVRHLDLGRRVAAMDEARIERAPLLVVLTSLTEDRPGWLAAGQALQRALLVAAAAGVQAGFTNGPCSDPDVRTSLRTRLGLAGHPQVLVRFGFPVGERAATRRLPVDDVLTVEGAEPPTTAPDLVVDRADWDEDDLG